MSAAAVAPHPAELIPAGEAEAIARVVELTRSKLQRDYAHVRPVLRDQHPTPHG